MEQNNKPAVQEEKVEFDWLSKENIKKILWIALAIILMLVFFQKFGSVLVIIKKIWTIIFPFVLGACIAFIVNVPMNQVENKLLGKKPFKGKRILAWFLTMLAILAVIAAAMGVIIPKIVDTAYIIAEDVKNFGSLSDLQSWVIAKFPQTEQYIANIDMSYQNLVSKAMAFVQKSGTQLLNSGVGVVSTVASGVVKGLIGFAFSVYVLFQKEKLAVQGKKVLYALFPEHVCKKTLDICSLSFETFSNFIRGQVLEACILGGLFLITMPIFRMPYALLCAVLIAITALIPIFGAFLGGGLSALLILIESPQKAIGFLVLFIVLQQIEGKLIYPHVVGGKVGLPSIWVLFAITTGEQLMGVAGMLIFVPLCSVLYALFREFVYKRLQEKGVTPDKWALNPPQAAHGEPILTEEKKEKLQHLKGRRARTASVDDAVEPVAEHANDFPEDTE